MVVKNYFALLYNHLSDAEKAALPAILAWQWHLVSPEAKKQYEAIPGLMEAIKKELSALDG